MRAWVAAHTIAGFVLLAYGISYLIGLPFMMTAQSLVPDWGILQAYGPRVLVVYGPGLAALVLVRLTQRDASATDLLRRLIPVRGDLPWAAGIIVFGSVSSAAALRVAGVAPGEMFERLQQDWPLLVMHLALQVAITAIGEELGWRGWLLPRLAERVNRIRATLVTAVIWALWHAPIIASGLRTAAMFILGVLGLSALFTWVWAHTDRRLFAVVVAHAAVNAPITFWEQTTVGPDHRIMSAWYALEAGYAAAGIALAVLRWRWWTARETEWPDGGGVTRGPGAA